MSEQNETLRPQSVQARQRILASAERLFRANGIGATGMDLVAAGAPVSKRTLYRHFPDKTSLIRAYLAVRETRLFADGSAPGPRERILSFYDVPAFEGAVSPCPFIAASVEHPNPDNPAHQSARDSKLAHARLLSDLAEQLGIPRPDRLADLLALLYDGALARAQVLNDPAPLEDARRMAETLLDEAVPPQR